MMVKQTQVNLKIALGTAAHTLAVKSGEIPIEGVRPEFIEVEPIIGAFRRMVRDLEFDVCEMAPTTYLVARSQGAPFIALPIFLHRLFHHGGIVCRSDAGIASPKDLEGKRVGVRAYSVTTGVWKRGIMADDNGLDLDKVTWVVDDEEAVAGLGLPENVVRVPDGETLVSLWSKGQLEAAFTGPAGIGRQGPPTAGWNVAAAAQAEAPQSHDLFPDPFAQAADFYRRTGIYPHHGLIVVKESVLTDHPYVARAIFEAMVAAKQPFLDQLRSGNTDPEIERYRRISSVVGADPLPYGIADNRASIDALTRYAVTQKLIAAPLAMADLFVDLN